MPKFTPKVIRIPVRVGLKNYVVVRTDGELVRIVYVNAVLGEKSLDLTGKTAKKVLEAEAEARQNER